MKRISSNSVSEYTDYFRYILTIVLVFFILCCEAVFVFAATQQKTPERIAFFPVLAIVTGMALAIFAYQNFTHVTVNTIINSEGLHSSRFGRELKELNWDDVKDVFPNAELMTFRKSYRTTDQIMAVANAVSESIGLDSSELSVRQGRDVTFNKVDNSNIPAYII